DEHASRKHSPRRSWHEDSTRRLPSDGKNVQVGVSRSGTFLANCDRVRTLRVALLLGGAVGLVVLTYRLGMGSVAAALIHVTWWQFTLICLVHGVALVLDASAWRYTFTTDRVPLRTLIAARCAGDAINVLTAVASVGGDAIKPWLLRHELPYEESIP